MAHVWLSGCSGCADECGQCDVALSWQVSPACCHCVSYTPSDPAGKVCQVLWSLVCITWYNNLLMWWFIKFAAFLWHTYKRHLKNIMQKKRLKYLFLIILHEWSLKIFWTKTFNFRSKQCTACYVTEIFNIVIIGSGAGRSEGQEGQSSEGHLTTDCKGTFLDWKGTFLDWKSTFLDWEGTFVDWDGNIGVN